MLERMARRDRPPRRQVHTKKSKPFGRQGRLETLGNVVEKELKRYAQLEIDMSALKHDDREKVVGRAVSILNARDDVVPAKAIQQALDELKVRQKRRNL